MSEERITRDSMGEMRVPADAYWDAQTARARDNFPISGMGPLPVFVWASVLVKWAAANANTELGLLDSETGKAIMQAADEVMAGDLADQFVVDVFQAGAGTSHHMNVNEVLASRASEILGGARGDFSRVHPNDHVNYGQSTNDVIPTAIRVGAVRTTADLLENLTLLEEAFASKGREFDDILKSGRTHLQDAVPIRLGQEFAAWASALGRSRESIATARTGCLELGIGGSAAGTGLNNHPEYRALVCKALSSKTGEEYRTAVDMRESMQSMQPFVLLSGTLRALSVELSRICNDLRLLSSGPTTGLGEIRLPPVQPGSSIMPGKVNPVICEMVNQVCFQVMGNDHTVAMAAGAGQLELNVMMPVLGFNLLWSIEILSSAVDVLTRKCVTGIEADREQCERYAANTLGLATALNPCIGYDAAAEVVKEAQSTGKTIAEVVLEKALMTEEEIAAFFEPHGMTEPGIPRCPDQEE
ncbi:aspartate ammonia-lyase [Candidatus Zixiibacteriota bacterium]